MEQRAQRRIKDGERALEWSRLFYKTSWEVPLLTSYLPQITLQLNGVNANV